MGPLSVVIVNWNAGAALEECLTSLFASDPWGGEMEVFLVDNGSTDGSQAVAAKAFPTITLVQNADNRGFASAINQGLHLARGELALILNPDVALLPTAIPRLVAFMVEHAQAAVVGPKLLNPDGSVQGSARRDPSPWTGLFGRSALLTRLFPGNPISRRELPGLASHGDEPLGVDWVSGACFLVRRKAYEEIGLMDERFFLFWEDADWCLRFRRAGWRVYYLRTAVARHRVGVSRARRPIRSVLDFHRSAYYFYRKHHLASAAHPMMAVLVAGLLASLGARVLQALLAGAMKPRGEG